jgi:hypothetical protein
MTRKLLLGCGVLSSLLYAVMLVVVPLEWEAYSSASQTVSELSAIGAPTRSLWSVLAVEYGLLLFAFAWGVWRSTGSKWLRVAGGLLLADAVMGFAWPPMHLREDLAAGGGTLTDTLHIVCTTLWAVLVLFAMAFAARALSRLFRVYSVVTMGVLVGFGTLTGSYGARIGTNLPTPWVGVWERINIGAFMLWVVVLAVVLLHAERESGLLHHERIGGAGHGPMEVGLRRDWSGE